MKWPVPAVVGGVAGAGLLLKWLIAGANIAAFQWLLVPTVRLTSLLTGSTFTFEEGVGYLDSSRHFVIVSECAGLSFFVIATVSCVWLTHGSVIRSLAGAYALTIVANAVRISLALTAHRLGLAGSLLTAARLHELIGIAVYLSMLMAAAQLIRRSWAPLIWYFSFTIAIPLLHVGASVKLLGHAVMILAVAAVIAAIWSFAMKKKAGLSGPQASDTITRRIEELSDWRGKTLARLRQLIHDADPKVEEEWKWMGTPVWSHEGGITTGESYKEVVKLTFFRGAALDDPKKLFNSSLEGNVRRAIDFRKGEKINETAFKALIRSAVAENLAVVEQRGAKKKAKSPPKRSRA